MAAASDFLRLDFKPTSKMSFWPIRKRIPSEAVVGAQAQWTQRISQYGPESPFAFVNPDGIPGVYAFHEGELMLPGSPSFVFEPTFELPIKGWWGAGSGVNQGFAITGNMGNQPYNPQQPPQIYSYQGVKTSGIGGLQAGGVAFQPLLFSIPTPDNPLPYGGA